MASPSEYGQNKLGLSFYSCEKRVGIMQPGDLGVLRGVVTGFSEEARTRSFASLALASFAVAQIIMNLIKKRSILECT